MIFVKTADFDYELPEHFIAQTPIKDRDHSKLLVLNRQDGTIEHHIFNDIMNYLNPGDALVINDTKVMPARLFGTKEQTGAVVEILMLKDLGDFCFECLSKPAKRIKVGTVLSFGDGKLKAICTALKEEGIRCMQFSFAGNFYELLEELGEMPLPPYIHETLNEPDRYQTIYAKEIGSAAAPTAGLHFTEQLLEQIKKKGILVVPITLHVGLGTFRPVNVEDVTKHQMHSEFYTMSEESAAILNSVKEKGNRIISVGTTSTRTLETVLSLYPKFQACSGWTDIFIYPGYQWKAIDGLITNFHLPKSTLLMLVSAFASKDLIWKAYHSAKENDYRFFSFGDAMLIL